jgi:AcrR family transcriptional regulator
MRALAEAAGIKAASVYYYYKSKEAILDAIYNSFELRCVTAKPELEKSMAVLENGAAHEILSMLRYPAIDPMQTDLDVIRIIWTRRFLDSRARRIYQRHIVKGGVAYMEAIISTGQKMGFFSGYPKEIEGLAVLFLLSQIHMTGNQLSRPDPKAPEEEPNMAAYLSRLLLKPKRAAQAGNA